MGSSLHNELKKEFQLERLILFSDAVFAIAITLLIIEIKVPELHGEELTENRLLQSLAHLIPKFIGFFISFLLIGLYWTVHHRLFGFVKNYNGGLIWLNIFFLMAIVLMPFTTALYSEYALQNVISPVIIYAGNLVFIGLMNFSLWRYVSNPKHNLSENLTKDVARYFAYRSVTVMLIFVVFAFVYLFSPFIAFWIPITIPLVLKYGFSGMKKKLNAKLK
jgi:uncharacterized membrane protein